MTRSVAMLLVCALAWCGASRAVAQDAPAAKGRTLLMVDDHDVLYRAGTERVAHPATQHSERAVMPADKPWERLIGYTSVYRDPSTGKYQLWYQAYAGGRGGDRSLKCVLAYAESDDGIHWIKPELDLFPFNGEKSNIVLGTNSGFGDRYGASVLVEPHDPDPSRRYKLAHYDWAVMGDREEPGLHVAFSPDGIHWTRHPGTLLTTSYGRYKLPPFSDESPYVEVPPTQTKPLQKKWFYPRTMSDVIDVFWDPVHREYVINSKMWIDGPAGGGAWKNVTGQTRSKDFIHWSPAQVLVTPDDLDQPFSEFHGAPTFYHKGQYFSLVQVLDRRYDLQTDIELMVSADGKKWRRPYRKDFFLPRGKPEHFNGSSVWSSTPPVVLDDEIRFYYGGYSAYGKDVKIVERSGIGMASIPMDRFGGIRPVARSEQTTLKKPLDHIGQVTLRPLDLGGVSRITVNADASDGAVRVELLDDRGYRIRGYARDDCTPMTGDKLAHEVAWSGANLAQLSSGAYMLRIHLDHATLYAVTFE